MASVSNTSLTFSRIALVTTVDYLLCFIAGLKCKTAKATFSLDVYTKYTLANWFQTLCTCVAVRHVARQGRFGRFRLETGRLVLVRELKKLALLWLGFDLWFYCVHRLAHLHKGVFTLCHSFHHEAKEAEALDGLVASPFDTIVLGSMPLFVGMHLARVHEKSFWLLLVSGLPLVMLTHSKFNGAHLVHHRLLKYNFGATPLFDVMFGTRFKMVGELKPLL
jgi:sterol desaturase/sphingolipid hydroxylase (fatty acid hydroxylase superfamily)